MIKAVKDINVRDSDIRNTDVFHIYGNNAIRSATELTSKKTTTADDITCHRITEHKTL